jgi:hypothetical protein
LWLLAGLPPFIEEGEDLDPSVSAARIECGRLGSGEFSGGSRQLWILTIEMGR